MRATKSENRASFVEGVLSLIGFGTAGRDTAAAEAVTVTAIP
jgi:hypothetical protein